MKIKSKIFKRKTGKSKGKWICRMEYFDSIEGRRRTIERQFDSKGSASDFRNSKTYELNKTNGQSEKGEKMTFDDLADKCEIRFYKKAEFAEGRKTSGVRSLTTARSQIKHLRKFFGKLPLSEITTETLDLYKSKRLSTVSPRTKKSVKLSTINRELSTMRRMTRYAFGKGWMLSDIFIDSNAIDTGAETERKRVLTTLEEKKLLDACTGTRTIEYERRKRNNPQEKQKIRQVVSCEHPHLRAMIILALDSGMRRGEILKSRWQDYDFDNNLILIVATHTKTQTERLAPLSDRAKVELNNLREIEKSENPFPFKNLKRSFDTAKDVAGIKDLHFHDLRRTCISRWQKQGVPLGTAAKLAGHTQVQTTLKYYTASDAETVQEVAATINKFHSDLNKKDIQKAESGLIN